MTKHKPLYTVLFAATFLFRSIDLTKQWIEYPGFDSPSSWVSGDLPCSHDEIIFPESYSSAILLPTTIDITGITLPNDGALILQSDAEIVFSSGIDKGFKCTNYDQIAELKATPPRHWFDPHNWLDLNNNSKANPDNAAVPHLERVPCSNELVQISMTGALSIDLSDVKTLRIGQINLDGSDVSEEFMKRLFKSELGEVMFRYASLTQVEYYKDKQCGCHHSDVFWEYEWNVCKHVKDMCKPPKCHTPIIPSGHCCAICGVMMKVIVDKCEFSYQEKLSHMIAESLKDQAMEDQLSYHVGYVDAGVATYLQVIIVETNDYEGSSVKFIDHFNATTSWDLFKTNKKEFFTSGHPYNPNGLRTAFLWMIGTLFGVLIFFVVIFVQFESQNGGIPRWMNVRWFDIFQSPFVFARFDNSAAAEGETAENVLIGVQQYSKSPEYPENVRGTSTSFDNPMFVDNQAANVAASKYDDDPDDIPLCEEELTEIELEGEIEGKL